MVEEQAVPSDAEPPNELALPINVRSLSLATLAVLGVVFVLHWAAAVFIPVMIGVTFSYALDPLVDRLQNRRVPRALSAAVLLLGLLGGTSALLWSLADDANALVASMPQAAQKLRQALGKSGARTANPIDKVQQAATQIERAAEESAASAPPTERGVMRVQVEKPRFNIRDYLWTGTLGLVALLGQVAVVFFLTFFILASGDTFRLKAVRLAGPRLASRRITVEILDEIDNQVQRYLLVMLITNLVIAFAIWGALAVFGLERAAMWGATAGVLHVIPYVGSLLTTIVIAIAAFLQFGTLASAAGAAVVVFAVSAVIGMGFMSWLHGRATQLNAVAVFVSLVFFGWLWGGWGLLLGAPLASILKTIADRVPALDGVGELLGR